MEQAGEMGLSFQVWWGFEAGKLSAAWQAAGKRQGKVFSAELQFADALVRAVPLLCSQTCRGLENWGLFLLVGFYRGMVPDSALYLKGKILQA